MTDPIEHLAARMERAPWAIKPELGQIVLPDPLFPIDSASRYAGPVEGLVDWLRVRFRGLDVPVDPVDPLFAFRAKVYARHFWHEAEALVEADRLSEKYQRRIEVVYVRYHAAFSLVPLLEPGDRVSISIRSDTHPDGFVQTVSRARVYETVTTTSGRRFRRAIGGQPKTYTSNSWRQIGAPYVNLGLGWEYRRDPHF